MTTPGCSYWRARLRPYAVQGFARGWLDDRSVTLEQDVTGKTVRLDRPKVLDEEWLDGNVVTARLTLREMSELDRIDGAVRFTITDQTLQELMAENRGAA